MQSVALGHPDFEMDGTAASLLMFEDEIVSEAPSYLLPNSGVFSSQAEGGLAGTIDIALALMPPVRSRADLKRTPSSRQQIERALCHIEQTVPVLMSQESDQVGFLLALSQVVIDSLGHASPTDDDWIIERLAAILAMHGLR
jgi:hypothetical protein